MISRVNIGAYESPFSGVGVEFHPLGSEQDSFPLVLHETGFIPQNSKWIILADLSQP